MNDDLEFELRTSWRQFDVPSPDEALQAFERSRQQPSVGTQPLVEQAIGILMAMHSITDGATVRRRLVHAASRAGVPVSDLAQAVVELATGAPPTADARALDAAKSLLTSAADRSGALSAPGGAATRPSIDLRAGGRKPTVTGSS